MAKIKYHIIDGKKECGKCGEIKPISSFYKHKKHLRSYCKKCQQDSVKIHRSKPENKHKWKAYSKKHMADPVNKKKKQKSAAKRMKSNKLLAISYNGGGCFVCGYNKCSEALEFHHVNPSQKQKTASSRGIDRKLSFKKMIPELDKCVLLCCRCHREVHAKIISL